MLTEAEVEEIRQGIRSGLRGPVLLNWLEKLLRDRDERLERDREIAAGRLGNDHQPRQADGN